MDRVKQGNLVFTRIAASAVPATAVAVGGGPFDLGRDAQGHRQIADGSVAVMTVPKSSASSRVSFLRVTGAACVYRDVEEELWLSGSDAGGTIASEAEPEYWMVRRVSEYTPRPLPLPGKPSIATMVPTTASPGYSGSSYGSTYGGTRRPTDFKPADLRRIKQESRQEAVPRDRRRIRSDHLVRISWAFGVLRSRAG
jgi:hypothetical protein